MLTCAAMRVARPKLKRVLVGVLGVACLSTVAAVAASEAFTHYWDPGQILPPVVLDLPDSGPRLDGGPDPASVPAFARALEAFRQRDLKRAVRGFRDVLSQTGQGFFADASRAYLAETLLVTDPTPQQRLQAIELYRALVRESDATPNGMRAMWREGDLYVDLGMAVEAKASYERAAGATGAGWDRDRALLGLGAGYLRWGKWHEASLIFETLRRSQGPFVNWANVGLAESLYAMKRFQEARAIYESCYRSWPDVFKARPVLMLKLADTQWLGRQDQAARRLYAEIFNVHPKWPEAAIALIRIGDTLRRAGLWSRAAMFYGDAVTRYPGSQSAAVGRMRLAQLGQDVVTAAKVRGGGIFTVAWQPFALSLSEVAVPLVNEKDQRQTFDELAQSYDATILGSEARFHLGEYFEARHDDLEAARIYDEVVQRGDRIPGDPWPERALQRLAVVMTPWIERALRRGDDLTAVTLFRRSRGRAQETLAATALLLPLADAHRRVGATPEAVKLYQTVLQDRFSPSREDALIGLGWSYLDQEDFPAARRVFERYRLQFPMGRWTNEAIRSLAFAFHKLNDRPAVIRTYRHWLQTFPSPTHPDRGNILVALANALADEGELKEALQAYEQAERTEAGKDAAVLLRRADALTRAQRFGQAAQLYARGARVAREAEQTDWALLQLGRMRRVQNRYADARTALDELEQQTTDTLITRLAIAIKADLPDEE